MISSVMNCDQIVLPAGLNITTEEKNMKRTISLCMTRYVIKLTFLCVTSYREFKSERTLFQQYDLIVLLFFFANSVFPKHLQHSLCDTLQCIASVEEYWVRCIARRESFKKTIYLNANYSGIICRQRIGGWSFAAKRPLPVVTEKLWEVSACCYRARFAS